MSREWREEDTVVTLANGTAIGGREVVVMAGPCSVESEAQIMGVAELVADAGATVLRGGAYKPRTPRTRSRDWGSRASSCWRAPAR